MKTKILISVLFLFFLFGKCTSNKKEQEAEPSPQIEALISQMTLEEKAGQMTQMGIPAICIQNNYWDNADTLILDTTKLKKAILEDHIGSFLSKGFYPPSREEYDNFISQIQEVATKQSRLKIPIIYATDAVHGAHYTAGSTVFPHQIAMAATWQPEFANKMGEITAYELRASNTAWNFAPVLDINWQAQWGRVFETFGEDPYLTSKMGNAFIEGSQPQSPDDSTKVATCLKHWIGYGSPTYGKDRKNAMIPERYLRQYYIPPFQEAIKNGAMSVMVNSGLINGIPTHINKYLITDILKNELGFKGVVISDWGDMQFLSEFHKTAENHKQAVQQMVNAGVDMCMVPYDASFAHYVVELVNEGKISESRINDAVRRILTLKQKTGLFQRPNTHYSSFPEFASEEFQKQSYNTASEAITLLKNNKKLPLDKTHKILVTGVAANSLNYLNGPWTRSWSGQEAQYNDKNKATILDAIEQKVGKENVSFSEGTSFDTDINTAETVEKAKKADEIIICLGEIPLAERPSDIKELFLPNAQQNLVKKLSTTGKAITLVLLEGRTRIIRDIVPLADAILMAYYPGQEGGKAIADIIFGDVNPSGKLPYSYQKYAASPMPYLHTISDRSDNYGGQTDYDPQWTFGFGLSYSKFKYESMKVSKDTILPNQTLNVYITLKNESQIEGKEVVQLYIQDNYASVESDYERLIRFKKITLKPLETKTIEFEIDIQDFMFVNQKNQWVSESGSFSLSCGNRKDQRIETQFILAQ